MSKIAITTIKIAIEIPDDQDSSYACDWLSETMRNPDIGVLDWGYYKDLKPNKDPITQWYISEMPSDYEEGDIMDNDIDTVEWAKQIVHDAGLLAIKRVHES